MTAIKLLLTLAACLLQADIGHSHGAHVQCSPWPPAFMADDCNAPDASKFMFEITSHRNRTGHWVTKVNFEVMHGANSQQERGYVSSDQQTYPILTYRLT
jgi:hypothetical protein